MKSKYIIVGLLLACGVLVSLLLSQMETVNNQQIQISQLREELNKEQEENLVLREGASFMTWYISNGGKEIDTETLHKNLGILRWKWAKYTIDLRDLEKNSQEDDVPDGTNP